MKLFLATLALCITTSLSFSQGLLSKIQSVATSSLSASSLPSLSNITGATDGIMGKLGPALALTSIQKPSVSSIISGFLKDKAPIMPLLSTDKTAYATKFSGLQSGMLSKLKTVLTLAQYSQFLGLKPKVASTANVLSNLFF